MKTARFISKNWQKGVYSLLVAFLLLPFFAGLATAATISLRSSVAEIKAGNVFSLRVLIDTQGKTINNGEAIINFPADLVEIVSVSSSKSIFSLWVEAPRFSNNDGTISFNGGVPNPGYTGSAGEAMSAVFKAKQSGTASFIFSSAAVRENDGLGTDILTGQGTAKIEITSTAPAEQPKEEKPAADTSKAAPVIESATYPDQNAWYNASAGVLSWKLPSGAVAVQTLLGHLPGSQPSVNYRPAIYKKEIDSLTSGVWYFHVRYQTAAGWSDTAHYRMQIDLEAPKNLQITPIYGDDGSVKLGLKAEDALSKVAYYNITVDNQSPIKIEATAANEPVTLPMLSLGKHQVTVAVYDRAGNKAEGKIEVVITPKAAPVITDFSQQVKVGETIVASGQTIYPQAEVIVIIMKVGDVASGDVPSILEKLMDELASTALAKEKIDGKIVNNVLTDATGRFNFVSDPLPATGEYNFWAFLVDNAGNHSPLSDKFNFTVGKSAVAASAKASLLAGIHLSYADWLLIIILLLIAGIAYSLYKIFTLQKKLHLITKISNPSLQLLLEKASKQLAVIEKNKKKQGLSAEEIRALKTLREIISQIEFVKTRKK